MHSQKVSLTRAPPPRVQQRGKGRDGGGWVEETERRSMGYSESISALTAITTTENSGHDVQST